LRKKEDHRMAAKRYRGNRREDGDGKFVHAREELKRKKALQTDGVTKRKRST